MPYSFIKSTIGKKIIVAVTGAILFGFVIVHLLGNLQIFLGPEKINEYAHFLRAKPELVWTTRIFLLVSVLLHILFTIQLTRINRASRPVGYSSYNPVQATMASRFMFWSGVLLAFYIVYHLLHLTTGTAHPQFQADDVYANMISGFSVWYVSLVYILAMIFLGFHLRHGVYSVFQTLGLTHPKYNKWRQGSALASAFLIPLGYISIPLAVWLGWVK